MLKALLPETSRLVSAVKRFRRSKATDESARLWRFDGERRAIFDIAPCRDEHA